MIINESYLYLQVPYCVIHLILVYKAPGTHVNLPLHLPTTTNDEGYMDDRENQTTMRGLTMKKFTSTLGAYYKVKRKRCEGEKQSAVTDYKLKSPMCGDVNTDQTEGSYGRCGNMCDGID